MIKLTVLIFGLLLSACQTTKMAKEEKPIEKHCGSSPIMYKEGLHTVLMQANKDLTFRDLGETDHLVFLNSYNKTPPPSNIKADRIRFYYKIGARQVFMVMSIKNCVAQSGPLSVFQVEAWLQGLVLDPSQFLDNETKI